MIVPLSAQDRHILTERISRLVTADLIARMRAQPSPPHAPDIVEVLDFVRRNPDPDLPRYLIVRLADGFAIARRAETTGSPPQPIDAVRHDDRDAAECAVLERRLRDYGVTW